MKPFFTLRKARLLYAFSIIALFIAQSALAQVHPAPDAKLHYRLIGFSVPPIAGCSKYCLEIAESSWNADNSFKEHILLKKTANSPKIVAKVPAFGATYSWRIYPAGSTAGNSPIYRFSTLYNPYTDTQLYKMVIEKNQPAFKDMYILHDATRTIYDNSGEPIWFLPPIKDTNDKTISIRDLKLSGTNNSLTLLLGNSAIEIDYDGNLLWQAPDDGKVNGERTEKYHHEFTKQANEEYWVLGWQTKTVYAARDSGALPTLLDTLQENAPAATRQMQFSNIIVYNKAKKVEWVWHCADFYKKYKISETLKSTRKIPDLHENAFFYSPDNKCVYVSIKNINHVVSITYPEGKVNGLYNGLEGELFCDQHGIKIINGSEIAVYNNNMCNRAMPKVIVMRMESNTTLRKTWEMDCPSEENSPIQQSEKRSTSGGNVIPMKGGNLFVSLCTPYSTLFIVNRKKQILWSAKMQRKNIDLNKWQPQETYRASLIEGNANMEKLIWNAN
ncbi:MAG: hypothetical protein EBX41_03015 [Chitinophagia bacterium]|nr:hypothetical protein [Chitinophagia bacterium]